MKIIVESGATKSDWRIVDDNGVQVARHLLAGMNVSSMRMERVKEVLAEGLGLAGVKDGDSLYLYAAGVVTDEIRGGIGNYISSMVALAGFDMQNDLVAAARSVLGHQSGVAAIMGTGSNTCFYDGAGVSQKVRSGGFILGDEGSASALGRLFIADFLKNLVPAPVAKDFEEKFDASYAGIVENVYRSPSPAAYLGGLAPFILSHYDDPYIKEMVDGNFRSFIDRALKCYDTETYPVGIVGGFGYACRDIFIPLCEKSGESR